MRRSRLGLLALQALAALTLALGAPAFAQPGPPGVLEGLASADPAVQKEAISKTTIWWDRHSPEVRERVPSELLRITSTAKDEGLRLSAACALGRLAVQEEVPAAWVFAEELLKSPDLRLVSTMGSGVCSLGPAARPAIPLLEKRLSAEPQSLQELEIAIALIELGSPEPKAQAAVAFALGSQVPGVQARALVRVGGLFGDYAWRETRSTPVAAPAVIAALGACLESKDSAIQRKALRALGALGAEKHPLRKRILALAARWPREGGFALVGLGPKAADLREALLESWNPEGPEEAAYLCWSALASIAPDHPRVKAATRGYLPTSEGRLTIEVGRAILREKGGLDALLTIVEGLEPSPLRWNLLQLCSHVSPRPRRVQVMIQDACVSPQVRTRQFGVRLLRTTPPQFSKEAQQLLRKIVGDKRAPLRGAAAEALAILAGDEVLDQLLEIVDGQEIQTRSDMSAIEGAIRGLAVLGPSAKKALPHLKAWTRVELPEALQPYVVRGDARIAIRRIRGLKLGEE